MHVEDGCRTCFCPAASSTWYHRRAVETSGAFSCFVLGFPSPFFPSNCRTQVKNVYLNDGTGFGCAHWHCPDLQLWQGLTVPCHFPLLTLGLLWTMDHAHVSEPQGSPQSGPSGDQNWRVTFHGILAAPVFCKWLYRKTICCSCLLPTKTFVWGCVVLNWVGWSATVSGHWCVKIKP